MVSPVFRGLRSLTLCAVILLGPLTTALETNAPTTTEHASGPSAVNSKTKASYEHAFSSLLAKEPLGLKPRPFDDWCYGCQNDCWSECMRIPPWRSLLFEFATTRVPMATEKPNLPFPPAHAVTAPTSPLRTTVVRATAAAQPKPGGAKASEEQGQKPLPAKPPAPGVEITDTYYTLALSGFQGSALPLVVRNGAGEALTLLAQANATFFSNFISSTLVSDLGLSKSIKHSTSGPLFIPEHDLHALLGYQTHSVGFMKLDVLVGVNDRLVRGAEFTVIQAPDKSIGYVRPDVYVGMKFLNLIEGLQLTAEYTGSREAGARDGLGVLVQRVFEAKDAEDGHDEL